MKKITKILVAVLALACMVSVMAVSASAAPKTELYIGASNNGQGFVFDSNGNPKLQTGKVDVKAPQTQDFAIPDFPAVPVSAQAQNCGCKDCTRKDCGYKKDTKQNNLFPGEYKDWDYIMSHQPAAKAPAAQTTSTTLK